MLFWQPAQRGPVVTILRSLDPFFFDPASGSDDLSGGLRLRGKPRSMDRSIARFHLSEKLTDTETDGRTKPADVARLGPDKKEDVGC